MTAQNLGDKINKLCGVCVCVYLCVCICVLVSIMCVKVSCVYIKDHRHWSAGLPQQNFLIA